MAYQNSVDGAMRIFNASLQSLMENEESVPVLKAEEGRSIQECAEDVHCFSPATGLRKNPPGNNQ